MQIYVAQNMLPGGDGSRRHPFTTISEAAAIARPGDEVIVAPGIYREAVNPARGGTPDARITYRSQVRHGAIITGSERVGYWKRVSGTTWMARIPNSTWSGYNPYTTYVMGDWLDPNCHIHTGEVYLNGKSLYEVPTMQQVDIPSQDRTSWEPADTVYTWYCEQSADGQDTIIYANFHQYDPNIETTEISVRRTCFYPEQEGCGYITLSGFVITQAATRWAPPTALQEGMVGPHWSKGWIIEDCEISNSKCVGISLGKKLQPNNENKWSTTYVKHGTQTERDAICQAVNEDWNKETIGSHIIRRCNIHDCGQAGIVGHLGCAFSQIEDNHIHHINCKHDLVGAEIGGIKLHAAIDTIIRRNRIDHCTRGLWLDWQAQGTRVTGNLFHDNMPPEGTDLSKNMTIGEDIFVEVSHGPTLIDNNLLLSDVACRLCTQGLAFVHNLIAGSFTGVGRGVDNGSHLFPSPRYTPYHVPHSTLVAGFMTILHGDVRFCNNVFIQKPVREFLASYTGSQPSDKREMNNLSCGTAPYEDYPLPEEYFRGFKSAQVGRDAYYDHLPVTFEGNYYFNGARPCTKETDAIVDRQHQISWKLEEEESGVVFSTNLYQYIHAGTERMITTNILGMAFEPEQKFENPDGSAITFNSDMCGHHRGLRPTAGPFEEPAARFALFHTPELFEPVITASPEPPAIEGSDLLLATEADDSLSGEKEDYDEAMSRVPEANDSLSRKPDDVTNNDAGDDRVDGTDTEEKRGKRNLYCQIALTDAEDITVTSKEQTRPVEEIFIKDNIAWIHLKGDTGIMEIDCAYGICHYIPSWSMEAEDISEVGRSEGTLSLGRCLAALLRIYIDRDLQDPEIIEKLVSAREAPALAHYGIDLRFANRQLKLVRDRRFITLAQAAEITSRASGNVIAEEV